MSQIFQILQNFDSVQLILGLKHQHINQRSKNKLANSMLLDHSNGDEEKADSKVDHLIWTFRLAHQPI
jgi:hypothetical protein